MKKTRPAAKAIQRMGLLLLMSCAATNLVSAANENQPARLTLSQAVELALKADYQVKSDANSLAKTSLAAKKTTLDTLPQATVEGQYQYQTLDNTYPSGYQIVLQQTLPTSYNLYGQKIDSSTAAAIWEQRIAAATLQISQAEVIYNTYADYLNVLKLQQMVQQHEAAVTTYRESNAAALQQLSLGKITKPDQLKIENYLDQAEYDVAKDRSDLEIARETLANQIGLRDLSGYRLDEVKLATESSGKDPADQELAAIQKQALAKRLELQKLNLGIKKTQRTWAEAKNNELPVLSFNYNNKTASQSYGLGYDFLNGAFSWQAAQASSSAISENSSTNYFSSSDKSYFTLKLSWNLDFGAAANTTQQAQYDLDNSRLEREKEQQAVQLEVKGAWADYQLARKQQELDQKTTAYHAKNVEIMKLQAKLGTIKAADLAEAQQDELDARITAIKSGYDQILAFQKLQKATGNLYPAAQ